jgi:hypothetical protein
MTDQLIKVITSALKDFDAAKQALDDDYAPDQHAQGT